MCHLYRDQWQNHAFLLYSLEFFCIKYNQDRPRIDPCGTLIARINHSDFDLFIVTAVMVPKHHNKAFILLLSNSGLSQLHFGAKFILVGACVTKIR